MPNLGLGQGRYVIDYAREDEQLPNFFLGLSSASGVGRVVPGFQHVLDVGVGGLIAEVSAKLEQRRRDNEKSSFYQGVLLALRGAAEHCGSYAALARDLADRPASVERENLLAIAHRMDRLVSEPTATMLEALTASLPAPGVVIAGSGSVTCGGSEGGPDSLPHVLAIRGCLLGDHVIVLNTVAWPEVHPAGDARHVGGDRQPVPEEEMRSRFRSVYLRQTLTSVNEPRALRSRTWPQTRFNMPPFPWPSDRLI